MSSAEVKVGAVKKGSQDGPKRAPVKIVSVAIGLGLLGACATPAPVPPPPPPPPPPPVVEVVPVRPHPPGGAAYVMQIPGKDSFGRRQTANLDISEDQTVWHFRSAWNVAALNCTSSQFDPVLAAYSSYISDHGRALKRVNDRIEAEYRREAGSRRAGLRARESHMTSVYNFFALPPARSGFCAAALDLSNRYLAGGIDPIEFAKANFSVLEQPFEQFFADYEQYQRASAEWDAKWGPEYGPSQPGWVAVQEAQANGVTVPTAGASDPVETLASQPAETQTVEDPETGAEVPVVQTDTQFVSQPVVEPVASDDGDN